MKKTVSIVLLLIMLSILLAGCRVHTVDSLDRYKEWVSKVTFGFSDFGTDDPNHVLPSCTFLDDYAYLEGHYHFYETDTFNFLINPDLMPDRSLFVLKYGESVYIQAKQCVLDNIPVYESKYYAYGNYQFYVNKNFMDYFHSESTPPYLLYFCSMVFYNDENSTIGFLGFRESGYQLPEKYINDLESNWTSFIDQYYGEYYDFSK